MKRGSKKGAVELSMNTIVIVIIGITLLTLGLRWVFNIFADVEKQRGQMSEAMEQEIRDMFGESDKPLNLLTNSVSVEQGGSYDLAVGIRNIGRETYEFSYTIEVNQDDIPSNVRADDVRKWFGYTKGNFDLKSGELYPDTINIDVPRNVPLDRYRMYIKLDCKEDNNLDYTQALTIRVT